MTINNTRSDTQSARDGFFGRRFSSLRPVSWISLATAPTTNGIGNPSALNRIVRSKVFKFVVGPNKQEFNVHEAVLSRLSKPLRVLLDGPFKEARELRVEWPEVDESTFVRFVEWAYTGTYTVARPRIAPQASAEQVLYSLSSLRPSKHSASSNVIANHCRRPACDSTAQNSSKLLAMVACIRCLQDYPSQTCNRYAYGGCRSVFSDCPRPSCADSRRKFPNRCFNEQCGQYRQDQWPTKIPSTLTCPFCKGDFTSLQCKGCNSTLSECPNCPFDNFNDTSKRDVLIGKFMEQAGTIYAPLDSPYLPLANTSASEDYTDVFLCHAKLYALGDLYDVPNLRQLSFHRLYATLKVFVLYPSRMNDIAALARYLLENTRSEDKIRSIIYLYYACIVEDASKNDGFKSLFDDFPDFAHGLIVKMSERLS